MSITYDTYNTKKESTENWNKAKKDLKAGKITYPSYLDIKNVCKPNVCIHIGKKGNSYNKQKKHNKPVQ